MPPWGLAKKPVKLFLNFSFGQFLSQPLEDDQIIITSNGIGCKDIYFNIDKLNALLSESGIPVVFCVAYIAEVVISLPWSVEIKGIDFVIQALSEVSSPSGTDELFNSMISSVSTAAFAVAKAAKDSTIPDNFFEETFTRTSDDVDLNDKEKIPKSLQEQAYQFFENLTAAAETMNVGTKGASSYVDQDSKQRIAHMIDSLIAQTTIVLRDVSIRIECELRLPGIDRASGLTLTIKHLSISNQYKTEEKQQSTPSNTSSSGRWSWLWWWQSSSNNNVPTGNSSVSSSPSTNSTSTPAGSLSTMLHKIIHLEEADLFWDLWSTSGHVQGCSSLCSSLDPSQPPCSPLPNKTCGPTADTLVSSAKLLTLSGSEHTARLSLRVGSALNVSHSPTPSNIKSDDLPRTINTTTSNSNTNLVNMSDFQLRLHVDLGPIVACVYPSQFYWLHMMIGQLVHIYDDYIEHSKKISEQTKLENDMTYYYSDLLTNNNLSNVMDENGCISVDTSTLNKHIGDYSDHRNYQKPHSPLRNKPREAHLIDLDLTPSPINHQNLTSTMLNSELFRSCLSDVSTTTMYGDNAIPNQHFDHLYLPKPDSNRDSAQVATKCSMSVNILCIAFVAFYEDESVLTREQIAEGTSFSASSSNMNSSVHNWRSDEEKLLKKDDSLGLNEQDSLNADEINDSSTLPEHQSRNCGDNKYYGHNNNDNSAGSYSTTTGCTAILPGPSIFFGRFHGLIPTPNCRLKSDSGRNQLDDNEDEVDMLHSKCQPMIINRQDVDTGRMSPSEWVSHLKYQFSNMAYPRDHLCIYRALNHYLISFTEIIKSLTNLFQTEQKMHFQQIKHFVGGLWHMELSNNFLVIPRGPSINQYYSSTQLCFNIQLFGVHLSECLFPSQTITTTKKANELRTQNIKLESFEFCYRKMFECCMYYPLFVTFITGVYFLLQLFHFPCPSTSSFPGSDHTTRSLSNEPAIKLHGNLYLPHIDVDSPSRITSGSQIYQDFVNEIHIDFTHFCVDLDISIMDRIHRITDAWAAASEAVSRLSPLRPSDFNHHAEWCDTDINNDIPVTMKSGHHHHVELNSVNKSKNSFTHNIPPSTDFQSNQIDSLRHFQSSTNMTVKCHCFELNLRFPIPIEAIKTTSGQKIAEIRSKLWGAGTVYNSNQSNSVQSISWWSRTVRKEYLSIFMKKIRLNFDNSKESSPKLQPFGRPNDHLQNVTKSKISSFRNGKHNGNEQELELIIGSISVFNLIFRVYIRISPSGQTDLVECVNENPMNKDFDEQTTTREQPAQFEVGVDLTTFNECISSSDQFYDPNKSNHDHSVEWSLWNQANPKQNCFIPLVVRKNFAQDAPKPHSKQITYYPGNKAHMFAYRQSASMHTHLFVHFKIPLAEITIEHKQTVELLCLRLMYDLLLWQSLLPNDRRLRATLKRPNHTCPTVDNVTNLQSDHRYWFLSDPAPLATIYAHPDAARAAAELEAISPIGYYNVNHHPSGLHYHSVKSDEEEDSDYAENDLNELYSNTFNIKDNTISNHYTKYNKENVNRFNSKISWSNDLRKNVNNRNNINLNQHSLLHKNRQRCTGDHRTNNNTTYSADHKVVGPLTNTSVQFQSSICLQLDINSLQFATFLPESSSSSVGGIRPTEKVIINASNTTLFTELSHNSNPNLNYVEMEVGEFDISYSCSQNPNSDNHSSADNAHPSSSDSPASLWPVLIHLSWDSIGYPYGSTLHQVGVSTANSSNEPTFSMALEHRQIHRLSDSVSTTMIQTDKHELGNPNLTTPVNSSHSTTTTTNTNNNFNYLTGLPNWFIRFCSLYQTPNLSFITEEYPSYYAPACLFSQHLHFEHLTATFSMPYPEYFILSTNKPTSVNYQMPILHFMIGCESTSITVNTAMEMLTICSSINNNNDNQVDMQPGMLVMAFINNLAIFVFPFKFNSINPNSLNPRLCDINSSHPLLINFRHWLSTFDLNKAVCIASLDHLELKCFSEPIIIPNTTDNSNSSSSSHIHRSKPSFICQNSSIPTITNRFDMRITNNLLKINTCADILVILHKFVELLTIYDMNNCNTTTPSPTMHSSPIHVKNTSSLKLDPTLCPQFHASSPIPSGLVYSNPFRNILDDNQCKSGSVSSLDLIQDAISDVDSVHSSPFKIGNVKRSSAVDIPSNILQTSSKNNESLTRKVEKKLAINTCPTPQPCRTVHSSSKRKSNTSINNDIKSCSSSPCPINTANDTTSMNDKSKNQLYLDLSDQLKSMSNRSHNSGPSSLSDDFVFIDPSTIPALNYTTPKEKIRYLLQPTKQSSSPSITTNDQTSSPLISFDIHENFYSPPSSTTNFKNYRANRWNRLFIDPVKIYPRPLLAITLYDFSCEWNIYGGNDLLPTSSAATTPLLGNIPSNEISIPIPPHNKSPVLSSSSPLKDPTQKLITTPSRSNESLPTNKNATNIRSGGNISPNQMLKSCPKPDYRFRHGQPLINKPSSSGSVGASGPVRMHSNDSRSENISLQSPKDSKGIRSRLTLYSQGGPGRQPDNCISFNISKLYFRQAKFPARMKKSIHQHQGQQLNSSHNLFSLTVDPFQRLIIHIPSVVIVDHVSSSNVNQLLYSYNRNYSPSINLLPHNLDTPMLRMVVVCWPVIPSHLEQDNISLLSQQQIVEKSKVDNEKFVRKGENVNIDDNNDTEDEDNVSNDCSMNITQLKSMKNFDYIYLPQPNNLEVEIKLSIQPLKINLDQGSFHGLLAMLLQLTNAEFTIPRRVYQRGYQSFDRLIEEVVEDLSSIISAQLPHAIVTSFGPMHEVTQFLLGLWDLVYQPVCSFYGTAELPNTSLDSGHVGTAVCKLGLFKKPHQLRNEICHSREYTLTDTSCGTNRSGIIHGLRRGTRSFSTSTLWATLQLSIQGIRALQSIAETAYDLVTPGPALRSRRLYLRQPADIREGFGNAVNVLTRGFQMVAEDLCGATALPSEVEIGYKGPVGMVGDVLRQIPPTMVTPIVASCEVTANILGGLRNQLRPEAKVEDEQKWKNTYGL
uniref:Autophagy-related protein 2 n=1 Tax=Schistosoma haematobium TaxID=6185 RepID=A0A095CAD7_SCHHA